MQNKATPLLPCQRENRGGARPNAGRKRKPLPQGQTTLNLQGTLIAARRAPPEGISNQNSMDFNVNEIVTSNERTMAVENNSQTSRCNLHFFE
jgi:hypothetical protein